MKNDPLASSISTGSSFSNPKSDDSFSAILSKFDDRWSTIKKLARPVTILGTLKLEKGSLSQALALQSSEFNFAANNADLLAHFLQQSTKNYREIIRTMQPEEYTLLEFSLQGLLINILERASRFISKQEDYFKTSFQKLVYQKKDQKLKKNYSKTGIRYLTTNQLVDLEKLSLPFVDQVLKKSNSLRSQQVRKIIYAELSSLEFGTNIEVIRTNYFNKVVAYWFNKFLDLSEVSNSHKFLHLTIILLILNLFLVVTCWQNLCTKIHNSRNKKLFLTCPIFKTISQPEGSQTIIKVIQDMSDQYLKDTIENYFQLLQEK